MFVELDLTPALLAQAEDRAHRVGQRSHVHVYYLMGRGVCVRLCLCLGVGEAGSTEVAGQRGGWWCTADWYQKGGAQPKLRILNLKLLTTKRCQG